MAIAWLEERYEGVENDLPAHGNGRDGLDVGVGGPN